MKVFRSLFFLCFTLFLVGCSSLEERQEKSFEWWNGFFGTGSGGRFQNLKGAYDGVVRQIHATVQIGKGSVDGLKSATEDIQERVQKVQDGVEKIQEGKDLIQEGVRGKETDPMKTKGDENL
ncbi:hypothetical protein A2635_02620 [Candidatus Peribacteria bacterium RIFCSPHIGHO2_01_FULL_51_9]|nr:MAG: hypothetical protein A2635_02620 [Candidatus Peribacteria bacterium RIFCSPHIGHO2_01_FULL_51_9]